MFHYLHFHVVQHLLPLTSSCDLTPSAELEMVNKTTGIKKNMLKTPQNFFSKPETLFREIKS